MRAALAASAPLAAGAAGAVLQFSGALKTTPALAFLPLDLTALALALAALGAAALALERAFHLAPALASPLLAAAGLWLWWVLAAAWSPWTGAERLAELALAAPLMLALGLLVGADDAARRAFLAMTLAIGVAVVLAVAHGLWSGNLALGGPVLSERARLPYQIAGLAIACAAGVAALRLVMARGGAARLGWGGLLLAVGVLLPGGRAALVTLGLGVALAPALFLSRTGRGRAALLWLAMVLAAGASAALALWLAAPQAGGMLATLERWLRPGFGLPGAREILWAEAWRLGGWLGLGPGGFAPALGAGLDHAWHPHNHAIQALVEGGAVGFMLWLLAFGGGALVAARAALHVTPERAAGVLAVTLPVALSAMVSTDLGNRMVWFALGLALSLAMDSAPRRPLAVRHV